MESILIIVRRFKAQLNTRRRHDIGENEKSIGIGAEWKDKKLIYKERRYEEIRDGEGSFSYIGLQISIIASDWL